MDDQTEPSNFETTLEEQEGVVVVSAQGELDLGSAYELKAKLDKAITQCVLAQGVVADLTHVQFMESVTLGVLVEQRNALRDIGKELVLVIQGGNDTASSEDHPVGRLLHLTGQAGEFSVYDGRVSAIKSVAPSN